MKAVGFVESRGKLTLGRSASKNDIEQWLAIIVKYLNDKVIVV
jgi:hypothetical protein